MTFVSVPTYLEKTTHSTPADSQIRSANAPDARHGDALADAGIAVRPLAAADFQAVMEDFEKNIAILRKNFYKEEYLK